MLFPHININDDMTLYLPSESMMKKGVDILKNNFPEVDMNAYYVKAMFRGDFDKEERASELLDIEGVAGITAEKEKDGHTLYQLSVQENADPKGISGIIRERYDDVIVENNANSIMPDNMVMILIIGVIIVFGILFLMCSSFAEALIFILTIGMAVIINMGTNALLPSVSMMTNTIVAVLQLVLSMDYSIILMNRFRQMVFIEPDLDKAMGRALKSASVSILSSGLTTIVGLLALVFMKFKIGLDLGLVLAKGVLCSLISIYTILPAFILLFYKEIKATEKKVFLIPTERLSRFEMWARMPLAILFVVLFFGSWHLSKRTELSYASIWESKISDIFPPENTFSLIYKTSSEDKIIALTDSLLENQDVIMSLNYPSMFRKRLTAEEMYGHAGAILELLPNLPGAEVPDIDIDMNLLSADNLKILYYACTHPDRDERMSFEDMLQLAEDAAENGLMPEGMDVEKMVSDLFLPEFEEEPEEVEKPLEIENQIVTDTVAVEELPAPEVDTTEVKILEAIEQTGAEESVEDIDRLQPKSRFTKEMLGTQMNSEELSEYLGFSKSQASAAYSMAGKRKGTMSPYEFINYMINTVLTNKLLRKMISEEQEKGLSLTFDEMNEVLAAPDVAEENPDIETPGIEEEQMVEENQSDVVEVLPVQETVIEEKKEVHHKATPMEKLAEMYASGLKYSSGEIARALGNAGIDVVDKGMIDLMFTYYGSKVNYADSTRLSLEDIVDFLATEVATNEAYSSFVDDSTRCLLSGIKEEMADGLSIIRKSQWSMAAIVTDYPIEAGETFDFVENTIDACSEEFDSGDYYLIGESVMYKEMKDGFKKELLFLTLLTVISIFLIVALTFKSVVIPTILVMTVMTGVYANVFFSGIGGRTMLYLAYLIVQSILMGATIDYGILFTNYYLDFRRSGLEKAEALRYAYKGSIHTIMTSGLIIILAPFIMSELLTDPTICSILSSLTFGALAAISLILFVLPAILAACDKIITRRLK